MVSEDIALQVTSAQLHLFLNATGYCFEQSREIVPVRGFTHVAILTQVSVGWILDYAQESGTGDCDCKYCELATHVTFEELITDADVLLAHGLGVKLEMGRNCATSLSNTA
jgi:hypothetical protein